MVTLLILYGINSLGCVREETSYTRYSFDQSEITGFGYILEKAPSGSTLHSDYYTLRYFGKKKLNESESLGLPYYTNNMIPGDLNSSGGGYLILLDNQLRQGGLLFGQQAVMEEEFDPEKGLLPYLPTEENLQNMASKLSGDDKLYSNRGIEVYYLAH
jgi:hypothetical protein